MHDAFKVWDQRDEPLEDTERRIHDGESGAALRERGRRYVGQLLGLFPQTVPPPGSVVMEVGSGVGYVMQAALERFAPRHLIGLDVAPSMIRKARARLARDGVADPRMSFLLYDGMSIPLRDGSVDYVYTVASLQHVPKVHVYALLFEIKRLLAPGGFCGMHLLSTALIAKGEHSFAEEISNQLHGRQAHWHHYYTFDELVHVLADGVGVKQIEIIDGDAIWVAFGKTGPTFRRAGLRDDLHLNRTRREPVALRAISPPRAAAPWPSALRPASRPVVTAATPRDAAIALAGGAGPVVTIPVHDAYEDVVQCLQSVLAHTPPDAAVLVLDDGSTDPRIAQLAERLGDALHVVVVLRRAENRGFVHTMNEAFALAGRRDVVILNSDVIVGPEWLERLREAAYSDTRIATATPLTNHGTIVSVPFRNSPSELPPGLTPTRAAVLVAAAALRLRPRLPTCVGHCAYVRRMALDVVGTFDPVFAPGYGEEVDFGQRCVQSGLAHVCADDVYVYHRGGASFGAAGAARALREDHERLIAARYPYYHAWVSATAGQDGTPLAVAIATARRALIGLTVAFDATALGPYLVGTQRVAVEVARALAQHPGVAQLVVVTKPGPPPAYLTEALAGLAKVRLVEDDPATRIGADVAYRPVQVWSSDEIDRLRRLGERCVVHQLDLIAFSNPSYFPSWRDWAQCRDGARFSLAAVDGVAFSTTHAEADARAEGLLLGGATTKVVWNGIDHVSLDVKATAPALVPADLERTGFVLCFGTDCRHKNRVFALRTFASLIARGYPGRLVLAGPRMVNGSSRADEADLLLRLRHLADRVVVLGEVSEEERAWLYRHAGLVLQPTLYEGFGLVPFEAALAGTPCLSSRAASLDEVLPPDIEAIDEWDPDHVADQILGLLGDARRRGRLVGALAARAREFTWARTAACLVELFDEVCRRAPQPMVRAVQGEGAVMPRPEPRGPSSLAMLDGLYPPEVIEAMRAVGQRAALRRAVAGVTVLAYRIASTIRSRLERWRGGVASTTTRE